MNLLPWNQRWILLRRFGVAEWKYEGSVYRAAGLDLRKYFVVYSDPFIDSNKLLFGENGIVNTTVCWIDIIVNFSIWFFTKTRKLYILFWGIFICSVWTFSFLRLYVWSEPVKFRDYQRRVCSTVRRLCQLVTADE